MFTGPSKAVPLPSWEARTLASAWRSLFDSVLEVFGMLFECIFVVSCVLYLFIFTWDLSQSLQRVGHFFSVHVCISPKVSHSSRSEAAALSGPLLVQVEVSGTPVARHGLMLRFFFFFTWPACPGPSPRTPRQTMFLKTRFCLR